ncbi:MAG: type II toxin-antitoxin system VapC family toxin [Spirosomataceae bacterium]
MVEQYLLDSNVVSDYLSGKLPSKSLDFIDGIINNDRANLSIMSRIELLGYVSPMSNIINAFVGYSNIFDLTEEIVSKTIALRRSRSIKIPDAIIASTAIVNQLTLITHNTSDFKKIQGLKIRDSYDL